MSQQRVIFIIKSICLIVFALGFIVLLGWIFKIPSSTSIIPAYDKMKVNTSLLFILSSIELYRLQAGKWRFLNKVLSLFISVVGFLTLLQYAFQFNLNIDEIIITDDPLTPTTDSFPGRMAIGTAFAFFLLGIAFCFIRSSSLIWRRIAQYLLHVISLIAFLALIGYALGVPIFYKLSSIGSMAIHTAICFLIISIAASLVNNNLGITGLLTGEKIGNRMARQLFPTLTVSVIALGLLRIYLHKYHLVSVEFGIGMYAISFLLMGLLLITLSATQLNTVNHAKTQAEAKLEELNKNLEALILQRTTELNNSIAQLETKTDELHKKEQLLYAIINNTSSEIFVKDVSGRYVLVNKKFANDFNMKTLEIIGKNTYDLFPKETADKLTSEENNIILTKEGLTSEISINNYGHQHTLLVNKFPLVDENNQVYAIGCVATDFTELKNAKTEQEILSLQLQKKNQQLLNFVHITSHNLRSPVSNLNSLLWLYKESETNEEKALLFEKFEIVIHNLSETLNELVDSLKIQEDTDKKRETLLFEDVFKKVKESMVGKILETEAVLSYNFTKASAIEYPRLYLESILQNLLSNSLKYRSPLRTPVIYAETLFENDSLVLKFNDNGLGIDMKRHSDKLFGLNKTFHRHAEAKGVGLFITKTQVEAMGGSITAISEVDKGTTFIVYFNKTGR